MSTVNCTQVTPDCPVERSLFGYAPNLGLNLFFAIFFGICAAIQFSLGIKYRTWTYMTALVSGCLYELVGYIGRIMMYYNAWSSAGLSVQLNGLISGPAYLAAGIYLTLKHVVLRVDQRHSHIQAHLYTWIFISGDVICLTLQGIGGGLAGSGTDGDDQDPMLLLGTNIMIAGVIFQVVVLVIFGYLLLEYLIRVYKHRNSLSQDSATLLNSTRFRCFISAIVVAFLGILIRSVYRVPELTGGWGNHLMRQELEFVVLESFMIGMSVLALTVFHPGWYFPYMADTFTFRLRRKNHRHGLSIGSDVEYPLNEMRS